ncbi:hypothetical protein HH214_21740 (plasmid) [Mucilaginibacter robiniae]|uniref:Uncharacterized protein n=1 Tax=Mucilaginibacter robiniae TaxID=2728022 RepID=A0A7L5E6I4_9SPHI|nr:hypothetical protein [Mucilaginibacter robiniae]QJD98581.1 hypothetical protein HH214_21740 [Mucilaginibacter robiniae]
MKKLNFILLACLLVVSSAFAPADQTLYPELAQTIKQLKKNMTSISYNRQEELTGVQQMVILARQQKKPVVIELLSSDGFTAPVAKAVFKAALLSYGISDIEVKTVGSAASETVAPVLSKMGFKVSTDNGLTAKVNEQVPPLTFSASPSSSQAVHALLQEGTESLLAGPDKYAVKLKYPVATGSDEQARKIALEMTFIAMKIKDYTN